MPTGGLQGVPSDLTGPGELLGGTSVDDKGEERQRMGTETKGKGFWGQKGQASVGSQVVAWQPEKPLSMDLRENRSVQAQAQRGRSKMGEIAASLHHGDIEIVKGLGLGI